MRTGMQRTGDAFAAGSLGGLANSLAVWLFGALGINAALGVQIAPPLTPPWLYPRIVWCGLWGLAFLLPFLAGRPYVKGALLSLGPTLVQLCIVFPVKAKKGFLGLDLGQLTPLLVVFFNLVWGCAAALWIQAAGTERPRPHHPSNPAT